MRFDWQAWIERLSAPPAAPPSTAAAAAAVDAAVPHALTVHFDPIFDLATGRVRGLQLLLPAAPGSSAPGAPHAWKHQAGYSGGSQQAIDHAVLGHACRHSREWADAGFDVRVCVPLSARTLSRADFVRTLFALLEETGAPASRLEVALTPMDRSEDVDACAANARKLAQRGIELALLGFGTGYATLQTLKRVPVRRVETEGSFDANAEGGSASMLAVLDATMQAVRALSVSGGVEDVRTDAQRQALDRVGATHARGPLLAPTLEAGAVAAWLAGQPAAR